MGAARARAEALVQRLWWRARPSAASRALQPLAWLYGALAAREQRVTLPQRAPVAVVVVGNLVAGGAGKTPTVIALVQALRAAGRRPGVVSRGHGRTGDGDVAEVDPERSSAVEVGDEPLLIARRSGVPVWVGRTRLLAAQALCNAHPAVDVIVADDGLQHHALARDVEIVVFDERGVGNGLLLPAGPLREPLAQPWPAERLVLYNAPRPSLPLAGWVAERALTQVLPLGGGTAQPLASLRGHRLVAAAGIAAPERFFDMLEAAGLTIERLPLPDHHDYATLPWPAATPEVIVTEKDAVKLAGRGSGGTRVWVAPLDFRLPAPFVAAVLQRLGRPPPP
jgi:tetraacyldisaccharide 4'-kinase